MTDDAAAAAWRRVERVLGAALELPAAERARFLDAACAGDAALRREVESLLAADAAPGALDRLAAGVAPLAARARATAAAFPAPGAPRVEGRYEGLTLVGGGGMGVVYRAVDAALGREVALKFLHPRFDADDSAAERFRLEARMVASLEHPNICTVHEIGETSDGRLFLAMPYYDGETLQARLDRGPLPIAEAVGIAAQMAAGLAKAHARGIVHRDVKPSNVLVTADGVVKLLDFGIAKLAGVALTGGGAPLGTVAYMSPEQAAGDALDHRTDLWSLGVVLYEMLAGRRPFPGTSATAVTAAVRAAAPPPVASLRPDVPPALAQLVAAALAKNPAARPASAEAMTGALRALGYPMPPLVAAEPARVARPMPTPMPNGTDGVRRRRLAVAGGVALAAVAALAWWRGGRAPAGEAPTVAGAALVASPPAGDSAARAATVAVLPFVDRSPGRDQEYFSDGLSEELIAALARAPGLRVASRTSSFAYKGRAVDVRALGAQLGVAAVLEGSVRRVGDTLRITAQLVSARDGYQVWSDSYDRPVRDAFAVQTEIARAVRRALGVAGGAPGSAGALDDDAPPAGAPGAAAYDEYLKGRYALYLRGRYAWYSRTEEGLRTAVRHFEAAVAQAPDYARAHAGLADAYAVSGFYDFLPPDVAFPRAEAAARRALALDPGYAAPHATLGYVALYHAWDLPRAEAEFRRAIALDPNYSTAHQWYGNLLGAAGRFAEASREMRRAEELDPLSLIAKAALGWVMYQADDQRAALAQFRETLDLNPDYAVAHLWRGWALAAVDSLPAAVAAHRRAVAGTDSAAIYVANLARTLAADGQRDEATRLLRRLQARGDSGRYVPAYEIAKVHLALGDVPRALAWLERARAERSHSMVFLRVDRHLAPLRGHPAFARLKRRVFGEARPVVPNGG